MTTVIGGSAPSITFSDSTTQSTAALPLTGGSVSADITVHGLTVGQGAGSVSTNTAVGASALALNSTGSVNTAVGANSMATGVVTGTYNSGFGFGSLYSVTSGGANSAIGASALQYTTTGSNNTGVGTQSLYNNTTASYNTAVGYQSLYNSNHTADVNALNTAIGYQSGLNLSTGNVNVFVGSRSGSQGATAITGTSNTCVGDASGYALAGTASSNTLIGQGAGSSLTTGSNNVLLGVNSGADAFLSLTTNSNLVVLGNNSTTTLYCKTGTINTSDIREKTNIRPITLGLDFVNKVNTIAYQFKVSRDSEEATGPVYFGWSAQDVQSNEGTEPLVDASDPNYLKLAPTNMVAILWNAVQQLNALVTEQATEIQALKAKVGI